MTEELDESTPLKVALFESVRHRIAEYGFVLQAPRDEFITQGKSVRDIFQLVCKDAKLGYRVQPNVGVRIERVEEIFHRTSGFRPEHQDGTSTMGAPVGVLLDRSPRACEFLLESEAALETVTTKIMHIFNDIAAPYFQKWRSLAAIDAELNDNPANPTRHRSLAWFRCSTGIIVAKLIGRLDYEQLAAFYTQVMTRDNKGFYLKRFQALLKSLESVAAGSGLA